MRFVITIILVGLLASYIDRTDPETSALYTQASP